MIYLAGPYTHVDAKIREERYLEHRRECISMMQAGIPVFSPIASGHTLLPELAHWTGDDWLKYDIMVLKKCTHLVVLRLDGWEKSRGVNMEIGAALAIGMPITYIDPVPHGKNRAYIHDANGIRMSIGAAA